MIDNNNLQLFLDNFVKTIQLNDTEKNLIDMSTTNLVLDSIEKNLNLQQFIEIVKQNNYSQKFTGLFICGFDINEDKTMINIIDGYNGLYSLKLDCNIYEQKQLDTDENEIYSVFSNPIDCYRCLLDINKMNNKNIEGLQDISYLL